MEELESQNNLIKAHLINNGSINPMEALNLYGCFRLSARIFDLRDQGMNIETELIQNGRKKYAEYKYKAV